MLKVDEKKLPDYFDCVDNIENCRKTLDENTTKTFETLSEGEWSGASHDLCLALFQATMNNMRLFFESYDELTTAVDTLKCNVDEYDTTSAVVGFLS